MYFEIKNTHKVKGSLFIYKTISKTFKPTIFYFLCCSFISVQVLYFNTGFRIQDVIFNQNIHRKFLVSPFVQNWKSGFTFKNIYHCHPLNCFSAQSVVPDDPSLLFVSVFADYLQLGRIFNLDSVIPSTRISVEDSGLFTELPQPSQTTNPNANEALFIHWKTACLIMSVRPRFNSAIPIYKMIWKHTPLCYIGSLFLVLIGCITN